MNEQLKAPCKATNLLKLIALVFMFIDHAGKMCFSNMPTMRYLGRLAFPIYAYCMVVGAANTRSMPKYILRLLLVGCLCQPLYMVAMSHTWNQLNIFFTLALGLISVWAIKDGPLPVKLLVPIGAMALATWGELDYGWRGVLLLCALYPVRDDRRALFMMLLVYCLFWGYNSYIPADIFGFQLDSLKSLPSLMYNNITPLLKLQTGAALSLIFLMIPLTRAQDIRLPRWAGYALYPAHLLALIALEIYMDGTYINIVARLNQMVLLPLGLSVFR